MKESIGITLAIFEHDAEITNLRMINDQKDGIILALRTGVADRDKHIGELHSDVVDLKRDVVQRDTQINRLESTYDSMYSAMLDDNQAIMKDLTESQRDIEGVDAELSVRKQDSKVLMQVARHIQSYQDNKHGAISTVIAIKCLLGDYRDVPEVPGILTLQTPSIGTRVVSKVDAPLTVSERAMEAVQLIVECGINRDTWVLYTKDDARDAMRSKQLIDELNELNGDLHTQIKGLKYICDLNDNAGSRKVKLQQNELIRLRKVINATDKDLEVLRGDRQDKQEIIDKLCQDVCCINEFSMLCDAQYDQLAKIEKLTTEAVSYVHIDEITKIIMEK